MAKSKLRRTRFYVRYAPERYPGEEWFRRNEPAKARALRHREARRRIQKRRKIRKGLKVYVIGGWVRLP